MGIWMTSTPELQPQTLISNPKPNLKPKPQSRRTPLVRMYFRKRVYDVESEKQRDSVREEERERGGETENDRG